MKSDSLASEFEIERSETSTEGLEERAWERHVHVKVVPTDTPKLHVNVIVVVLVYQLKVFHARFVHSAIEIENKGLHLLVPFGWLVKEEHDPLCVINLKLLLERLVFLSSTNKNQRWYQHINPQLYSI